MATPFYIRCSIGGGTSFQCWLTTARRTQACTLPFSARGIRKACLAAGPQGGGETDTAQTPQVAIPDRLVTWRWLPVHRLKKRMHGAPGEIRTPDLTLRRRSLYPAELRARKLRIQHDRQRSRRFEKVAVNHGCAACSLFSRSCSITDWISALAPLISPRTTSRSSAGFVGLRVDAQ
jgi:hypothetical protein